MKRALFIFSAVALFAFSGCQDRNQFGDDYYVTDSSIGSPYTSSDESTTTLVQYENASVEESNSQLILNAKQTQSDGTVYIKWTCDFSDEKLTKSVRETTFPTTDSAAAYYAQLKENYERGLEFYLKDNVVIENDTNLSGTDKSVMREEMVEFARKIEEKEDYVTYQVQFNSYVAIEIAAAENTAVYTYTYIVNGMYYSSAEELQRAIVSLNVGSQATVHINATPKAGGTVLHGTETIITIPEIGNTITVSFSVPVGENADGSAKEETVEATISTTTDDTTTAAINENLCPDDNHPHAIDMGTGVKWACCNVGAGSPFDYGGYFAWGETEEKSNYDWSTYKWCNGSYTSLTKYCTNSDYGTVDNKTTLELSDDAARVNWGSSWRMPTIDELSELNNNCTWTWMTIEDVNGYKVTASNGNSIFLPAAGGHKGEGHEYVGYRGDYWSSSLYILYPNYAHGLGYKDDEYHHTDYTFYRYYGHSVRPVTE